jgi:hypothetical protein
MADVEKLEATVKALAKQVQTLQDIEDINKLERGYGYFLEHLMADEIADCWAENGVLEWRGLGKYVGRETIRKQWQATKAGFAKNGNFIHPGPRYQGVVTVNPDGKTAAGRWYVAGVNHGMEMICENRYVKEDGVWKYALMSVGGFPKISMSFGGGMEDKEAKKPDEAEMERMNQEHMNEYHFTERYSRTPRQEHQNFLLPFSFKHPVTGKDVNKTVEAWNKAHPVPMPPGGEKWTAKK